MVFKGGYVLVDCSGLDLTETSATSLTGIWKKAKDALASGKPIVAYNCIYGTGVKVSPVACFGFYLASDEICIVGATLHIHITDNDKYRVLDVAAS